MSFTDPRAARPRGGISSTAELLEPRVLLFAEAPQDPLAGAHGFVCGCPGCRAGFSGITPVSDRPLAPPPPQLAAIVAGPLTTTTLAGLPQLSSLPGAPANLYLDFDGDVPRTWGAYSVPQTPAFDEDGNPTTFSETELNSIAEVWDRVADAYAPFNLNVTTVNPGADDVAGKTLRVVIGGSGEWYAPFIGGVAFHDAFTHAGRNWVYAFQMNRPSLEAVVVAHEAGHGFGLRHQSSWSGGVLDEYRDFNGPVGAIMAASYNARTLWWNGTTTSPTTFQDDMAMIARPANGFGYRADDFGDTPAAAQTLTLSTAGAAGASGILDHHSDEDWFAFTWTGGGVTIIADGGFHGAQLNPRLVLADGAGNVLLTRAASDVGETLTATLAAGTYRVGVTAQSHLDGSSQTTYGEAGRYALQIVPGEGDGQRPLLDAPLPVDAGEPTRIQYEDYDRGPAGAAYFEFDSSFNGTHRAGAVELEHDPLEGPYGRVAASEWTEYTVDVEAAGVYSVALRAAGVRGNTPTVTLTVDGSFVASIPIAPSGDDRDFADARHGGIFLPAGRHVLRLAASGSMTINWFQLAPISAGGQSGFGGTPAPVAGDAATTLQAEDYDHGGEAIAYHDTSAANTGDSAYRTGDGVDVGAIHLGAIAAGGLRVQDAHAGEWLEYTIGVQSAGVYAVDLQAAAIGAGAAVRLEVDGSPAGAAVAIPDTGSLDAMHLLNLGALNLAAGTHVLRLRIESSSTGGGPALDWLRLAPLPAPAVTLTVPDAVAAELDLRSPTPDYGTFLITRQGPTNQDLVVNFVVGGTATNNSDYAGLWGAAVIRAGHSSTSVLVRPNGHPGDQGSKTVTLALAPGAFYTVAAPSDGTVTIHDTEATPGQQPYKGSPFAVGGTAVTIQAEDYDLGGQGIAFNDTTGNNIGGLYRPNEAVDIKSHAGGQFRVSDALAGEWLEYTIEVAEAGNYEMEFRVSHADPNSRFHAEVGGVDVTGSLTVPDTNSFSAFASVRKTVSLVAGRQVLRFAFDANAATGYAAGLDWVKVTRVADEPPAPPSDVTLNTATAAYVRNGTYASANFAADAQLLVKSSVTAGNTRESYLKFDVSALPADAGAISSVMLRLYGRKSASGANVPVAAFGAGNTSWTEGGLTWNNRPATTGGALATKTIGSTSNGWYDWDVTQYVKQARTSGQQFITLALKATATTDPWAIFTSDEGSSNKPQLVAQVGAQPPQQPSLVVSQGSLTVPEGGQASFTARLSAPPASDVTVTIAKQAGGDADVGADKATLTFTPANWNAAQQVTLAAAQDGDAVNGQATFALSSSGLSSVTLTATEADDDAAAPTTYLATAATYVRDGSFASQNFGTASELLAKRSNTAGNTRETYLKFDLGSTTSASSVILRLYGHLSRATDPSVTTNVYSASGTSWSETGLTWNNRPAAGTTVHGSLIVAGTADQWYEVDLTAFVQAELAAGRKLVTLVLRNPSATDAWPVFASDETANGPRLVVT